MRKVDLIDLEPLFRAEEEGKLEIDPIFIPLQNNLSEQSDELESTQEIQEFEALKALKAQ